MSITTAPSPTVRVSVRCNDYVSGEIDAGDIDDKIILSECRRRGFGNVVVDDAARAALLCEATRLHYAPDGPEWVAAARRLISDLTGRGA